MGAHVWRRSEGNDNNRTPGPSSAALAQGSSSQAPGQWHTTVPQQTQPAVTVTLHDASSKQQGPLTQPRATPTSPQPTTTSTTARAPARRHPTVRPHTAQAAHVQPPVDAAKVHTASELQHAATTAQPQTANGVQHTPATTKPHPASKPHSGAYTHQAARPHSATDSRPAARTHTANGTQQAPGIKRPHAGTFPSQAAHAVTSQTQPAQAPLNHAHTGPQLKRPRHAGPAPTPSTGMNPSAGTANAHPGQPAMPGQPAAATTSDGPNIEDIEAAMAELRRKVQLKEAEDKLRQQKERQKQQAAQAAKQSKAKLARAFQFIAEAPTQPAVQKEASGAGQARAPVPVASEWDIARVMNSKSDHECLQVPVGAGVAEVRRSFRSLAMALHPDKCKLEGAAGAFQRIQAACNRLCSDG